MDNTNCKLIYSILDLNTFQLQCINTEAVNAVSHIFKLIRSLAKVPENAVHYICKQTHEKIMHTQVNQGKWIVFKS